MRRHRASEPPCDNIVGDIMESLCQIEDLEDSTAGQQLMAVAKKTAWLAGVRTFDGTCGLRDFGSP